MMDEDDISVFSKLIPYIAMPIIPERYFRATYHPNDDSSNREVKVCAYSKCEIRHTHNNSCCCSDHYKKYMAEKQLTQTNEDK